MDLWPMLLERLIVEKLILGKFHKLVKNKLITSKKKKIKENKLLRLKFWYGWRGVNGVNKTLQVILVPSSKHTESSYLWTEVATTWEVMLFTTSPENKSN